MRLTTSAGPAKVDLDGAASPPFLLTLTHGAGGGVGSADLLAARQAGLDLGGCVARIVQPYRVRGARAPGSAVRQDAAWLEITRKLRRRFPGVPLIQGGRSNGARVACRTAQAAGARAVLVINGAADPFGVPEPAGAIRVVVLPGATHTLARQDSEIQQTVREWLAGLLAGIS